MNEEKRCNDLTGKEWCTENAGWEASHESAWNAAYHFYKKYKSPRRDY